MEIALIHTFSAWIDQGNVVFDRPEFVLSVLRPWNQERVSVKIEKASQRRTLPQNRLVWKTYQGAIEHFAELSPFSKDELHAYFREQYCPTKEIVLPGGEMAEVKSTTRLTVEEMADYITKVLAHLARWGWEGE